MDKKEIAAGIEMNEKTNQDFNNLKPKANDPGFKEPIKDPNESDTTHDGMDSLDKVNTEKPTIENALSDVDKIKEEFLLNEEEEALQAKHVENAFLKLDDSIF